MKLFLVLNRISRLLCSLVRYPGQHSKQISDSRTSMYYSICLCFCTGLEGGHSWQYVYDGDSYCICNDFGSFFWNSTSIQFLCCCLPVLI